MSRKPENTFIASVHKHLPKTLHCEKMNNPYRSGTADVWYSGNKADMWIEYKFLSNIPKDVSCIITPDLSPLQRMWLRGRYTENRCVYVIVGCKDGGVRFHDLQWEQGIPTREFLKRRQSRLELAKWIAAQTC